MFEFLRKIISMGSNVLYYPGCLTKYALPDIQRNYEKILDGLGIDYIEIEEMNCCGSPVLNAGYKQDFDNLLKKNLKILHEYGVGKVLFNCPSCLSMFHSHYPGFELEHLVITITKGFDKLGVSPLSGRVTYHDPCHLGRYMGVYDEPRQLLRKLGLNVVEMPRSREYSLCCGGGGGLRTNFTEVSKEIAGIRISEALALNVDYLVTTCPMCYLQLKEAGEEQGLEVKELSEVIVSALG